MPSEFSPRLGSQCCVSPPDPSSRGLGLQGSCCTCRMGTQLGASVPPVRDSSLKPYSPTVPGAGLLCLPGAFPKWDSSALVSPHPPVLGPHCSPGIPQCWATAPQFSPRSQMMSQGQDSGVPHQAPSCAPPPPPHPMLFRGHRLGPSLLPVWVMSLLLGNLGELGGWAGWAWTGGGGSPLRGGVGWGEMPQPASGQAEAQGRRCLPWSGNREGFSSFTFRPWKAQSGSWLCAWGAW